MDGLYRSAQLDMASSIQRLAGIRALTSKFKQRCRTVEGHYLKSLADGEQVDWPKESESAAIEQLVHELAQEITGSPDISPAVWQHSRSFASEIQKPYLNYRESGEISQEKYERAESHFFRGLQMWCDHTDDFLRYLSAFVTLEEPTSRSDVNRGDTSESPSMMYDVAISFAGEDRLIAKAFAESLRERGRRVFYDEYEQASLWGRDLYSHLSNVYKNKAKYCLIIVSIHYARKLWTRHELRAAQSRAFQESSEYILPLRVDDTEIEGILPTTGYLHLQSHTVADAVALLMQKLDTQ